jgi:hypothetical protein
MSQDNHREPGRSLSPVTCSLLLVCALLAAYWYLQRPQMEEISVAAIEPSFEAHIVSSSANNVSQVVDASLPLGCGANTTGDENVHCADRWLAGSPVATADTSTESDSIMTDEKLVERMGVASEIAIDVLGVVPGASLRAMNTLKKCKDAEKRRKLEQSVCEDIGKILHYVLMDLDFRAREGESDSALSLANYYADELTRTHANNQPSFVNHVYRYMRIAEVDYPLEVAALQRTVDRYR